MEKKIKVIQICPTSASFWLNIGKKDLETIQKEEWAGLVAKNLKLIFPSLEIECWTPERNYRLGKEFYSNGVKFRVFSSRKFFALRPGMEICPSMNLALREEIRNAERDGKKLVIHFHEYHTWLTYSLLWNITKNNNVKTFGQHHGGRNPFSNLKKYKRFLVVLPGIVFMQFLERFLFKKVDTFYAFGDAEEKYLKKIAPNSKIRFSSMGIEEKYFDKIDKNFAKKKLLLDLNKKYVLFLGRIRSNKGVKELLEAFKDIADAELLLIGGGDDFKKYSEYAKKERIKNAHFLGPIYDEKKLLYLSAADCLVLPSHTEGAPVVLMEAIARNLPVVVSDVGGVRKMIENNREGLIIKPKSKEDIKMGLKEVLSWKRDIRKYAEKFKWKNIIKGVYEDYL